MNNCPKCGTSIIEGDKFCRVCGFNLSVPQNTIYNSYNQTNDNLSSMSFDQRQMINPLKSNIKYTEVTEDQLINEYIGSNAKDIKIGGFSFCTFLFGFNYLVYRQMYLLGFIWLVINGLAMFFFPSIFWIISVIVNIFLIT